MSMYNRSLFFCVLVVFVATTSVEGAPLEEDAPGNGSQTLEPQSGLCQVFDPCLNGGICFENEATGRSCNCTPGYLGSRCQHVDFCHSNPCGLTGTCISGRNTFTCVCFPGYIGKECNIPDPCLNTTCYNGGSCVVRGNNTYCQCPGPFTGKRCDMLCSANRRCYDRGTDCVRYNSGRVSCQCSKTVPRHTVSCLTEDDLINECSALPNPCNGGSCTDHYKGYSCSGCPYGRSGSRCEVFNPCSTSPCSNGGSCSTRGDSYVCSCPSNYQGRRCQWHKNNRICSVTCNATYFDVDCNANQFPARVRERNLFARFSDGNPACTCRFPLRRRSVGFRQNNYYRYRDVQETCRIPFNDCGSKVQVENGDLVYNNFLRFNNKPRAPEELEEWESDLIITRDRGIFQINLQCIVQTHVNASVGASSEDFEAYDNFEMDIGNRIRTPILSISYFWYNGTFQPTSSFFVDNRLYALVSVDDSYSVNSELHDKELRLRDCFATPTENPKDERRYYLLKNGCRRDKTFRFDSKLFYSENLELNSGLALPKFTAMFSFQPFTFKRIGNQLFVHCDADLCTKGDCNLCGDANGARRKRHVTEGIPLDMSAATGLEHRSGV